MYMCISRPKDLGDKKAISLLATNHCIVTTLKTPISFDLRNDFTSRLVKKEEKPLFEDFSSPRGNSMCLLDKSVLEEICLES